MFTVPLEAPGSVSSTQSVTAVLGDLVSSPGLQVCTVKRDLDSDLLSPPPLHF